LNVILWCAPIPRSAEPPTQTKMLKTDKNKHKPHKRGMASAVYFV
jgi:hypothetical protein